MDRAEEIVLARLHLGAILPRLEDIADFDPVVRETVEDWNFALRFQLSGGNPATTLMFEDGTVKACSGRINRPAVTLTFKDAPFLNKIFQGKSKKNPQPNLRGLFYLKQLSQIERVLGRLEHFLKPGDDLINDADSFAHCVRLSLYTLVFGVKEVGEHDPQMKPVASRLPNGCVEIRVAEGPAAHVAVRSGLFYPARGPAEKPSAILELTDLETAWSMIRGKLDTFAAIGGEKMKLKGYIPLLDGINPLLNRLAFYLSD